MEVSAVGRGYQSWRKGFSLKSSKEREDDCADVADLMRCLVALYHLPSLVFPCTCILHPFFILFVDKGANAATQR